MQKRTLILLVALVLCAPQTAIAAKRKKVETKSVIIPVYDTIRVVVTDTIKVVPKPAPRIDTLQLAHTPAEIDSLVEAWVLLHQEQSSKNFFGLYDEEDTSPSQPIDSLYKQRLMEMVSPVHLPYNYIVRNFITQYLNGRWSPLRNVLALSQYYFPIIEEELAAAGLPLELRYLPIIESNLSIRATSRMGAVGPFKNTDKNTAIQPR